MNHHIYSASLTKADDHLTQANSAPAIHAHPHDVLSDPKLSLSEKRAILASWASDAAAVENLPLLRQTEAGAIVKLEDVLAALKALDDLACAEDQARPRGLLADERKVSAIKWLKFTRRQGSRNDRDDDPPPCPASAAHPIAPVFVNCYASALKQVA